MNNIYENKKDIYLINYPKGFKSKISFGIIKEININNYGLPHICSTDEGSSGSPIFNILNYKNIGIHKGDHKKFQFKVGTVLKLPINAFFTNGTHTIEKLTEKINDKNMSNINNININSNLELNIDKIIEKLLSIRGHKPGKQVDLREEEIIYIIDKSLQIIKDQKALVELDVPLKIYGDIHGQYYDLLRIFDHFDFPDKINYLFLGNYIDFGKQSLGVICLLLSYKIKYPEKITLLRDNHESSVVSRINGFYDECKRRFNVRIWRDFTNLFNYLPFAAIIEERVFCVHSGLSPELDTIEDINKIERPTDIPDKGLLYDLLNSAPDKDVLEYDKKLDFNENEESKNSIIFGEKIVTDFIKKTI